MPDFNATGDVPPVKDGELSLKKMCEANGGKDSYEAVVVCIIYIYTYIKMEGVCFTLIIIFNRQVNKAHD